TKRLEEIRQFADAQVLFLDQRLRQPGQLGDPARDASACLAVQTRAGLQRRDVIVVHEGFGRRARGGGGLGGRTFQQAVVLRDVGERRKEERIRQVVRRTEHD